MMFERFTQAARTAVIGAQEQARALHHQEIRAEHLLLAVLADDGSISARVLREHGVHPERLAGEVARLGAADLDGDALREIGIDLAAVRERAEAAFGPGALGRPRPRKAGLLRRRVGGTGGHLRFSGPAKRGLEQSLRQALDLRHNYIGVDHILLGLLADDQDSCARTLHRLGADVADVRAQVRARLAQAA